jgi:lysyl-tRNA synthetase class 2
MAVMRRRAELYDCIRDYFRARGVLEVDTPHLGIATVTDPHIASVKADVGDGIRYLQTSPEFAMKRLLAAYPESIYQLGKVFRREEQGRYHNPEFTMLEWYRPDFTLDQLIDEVATLVGPLLGIDKIRRRSYAAVFSAAVGLDPHRASTADLVSRAEPLVDSGLDSDDRDLYLHLLFSHLVEPTLGRGCLEFIDNFPASQAALAVVENDTDGIVVARRFELFISGVELANGYLELTDAVEQRRRMQADLELRGTEGAELPPLDQRLLDALAHGMPPCAGVALGVDRLLMLMTGAASIDEVLAFDFSRA